MSNQIETDAFRQNLLAMFDETFRSTPPEAHGSIYLDRDTGWLQTLRSLSAAEASRTTMTGGTTIVAHAFHTRYYLNILVKFMEGERPQTDWDGSWKTTQASESEWQELRDDLQATYERVRQGFQNNDDWTEERIGGAMAVVVHSAYHLGAVRQLLKAVRAG